MNFLFQLCRAAPPIASSVMPSLEQAGYALRPSLSSLVGQHSLLQPTTPSLVQVCGMKHKVALRKRCKDCNFVYVRGLLHVLCKAKPRHNSRHTQKKEKNTWILTHATQSVKRPW